MIHLPREIKKTLKKESFQGKAIILVGPRQVGKTTLIKELIAEFKKSYKIKEFNCELTKDSELLEKHDLVFLKELIGDAKIVFIDEAQKVRNIGTTIKILVDYYKAKIQIYVTGSSSFNLLSNTQEPLTGRKLVHNLYPLSLKEIYFEKDFLKLYKDLEYLMIFGLYPEVVSKRSFEKKIDLLRELSSSYLYKDILEFQQVKNPAMLSKLIKALALQIGQEVSYTELSNLLGIDKITIERYIDLLEKSFVIFRLPAFSQNKRRELSKLRKIYFYDLGIRNAVINNFNFLDSRNDIGAIFENFMIVERLKYREYEKQYSDQYFWRTYDGSEVDLVEERAGKLYGYEFKWNKKRRVKNPMKWLEYPNSSFKVITKEDIHKFVF